MFTVFNSRVRYSETTKNGRMSVKSLFDYMQDCCIFQSEDLDEGVRGLQEMQRAWILASWNIKVVRWPKFGEHINVITWPHHIKKFFAYRGHAVETEDGELLVKGNSIWIFTDTVTGHPVRIPQHEYDIYTIEDRLDQPFTRRTIKCEGDYQIGDSFNILSHQIDSNGHTNNSQYILMAADCLPEDFDYTGIKVEYTREAKLGASVIPRIYNESEDRKAVELVSEDAKRYAAVEFSK